MGLGAGENEFQRSQMKVFQKEVFQVKVLESYTDRDHLKTHQYILLHKGFILTYTFFFKGENSFYVWLLFQISQEINL